jgi:hypothetical protein
MSAHRIDTPASPAARAVGLLAALALPLLTPGDARAQSVEPQLVSSKGPPGANHERAHQGPYKATGRDAKFAVIETSDRPKKPDPAHGRDVGFRAANNLGGRVKGEYDFAGKLPGQDPTRIHDPANPRYDLNPGNIHSTWVADIAAGQHATFTGVANELEHIYFGGLGTTGSGSSAVYNAFRGSTDWLNRKKGVGLFNLSDWVLGDGYTTLRDPGPVIPGDRPNDNGASRAATFTDWFARERDVLLVKSAGNNGPPSGGENNQISNPGDAFNALVVGATDASFTTRAYFSSYWLQGDNGTKPDRRGKPDILAPGTQIANGHPNESDPPSPIGAANGTSGAAPHVAGAAALLWEKGLDLGDRGDYNHLAHKAIILNSARKRGINSPENKFWESFDLLEEASDENYVTIVNDDRDGRIVPSGTLRATGSGTTTEWTPTKWSSDGRALTVTKPLDDEQGTGLLDAERVLIQWDGSGEQRQGPGNVRPIGWDKRELPVGGETFKYFLDFPIEAGTFITTTLAWDRLVTEIDRGVLDCGQSPNAGRCREVDAEDVYVAGAVPDFDLFIHFKGEVVARSIALGGTDPEAENVEHLHYPVPEYGDPRDYWIEVALSGSYGNPSEPFGLAWWTVTAPEPSTVTLLLVGGLGLLGHTLRRRGSAAPACSMSRAAGSR